MKTELYWLTLTLLMTALLWLPYIIDRIAVRGLVRAIADRQAETGEEHSPWGKRAMAAHRNAVENLAIFAPAVLIAHVLNVSTAATEMAAVIYFFARLAHYVVYTLGIPVLRTLAFAAGALCQLVVIATILGWM